MLTKFYHYSNILNISLESAITRCSQAVPFSLTIYTYAVYSHPQIASVGLTEENAAKDHDIIVGKTKYSDVAKGEAMMEKEGFAKAIAEKGQ